PLAPGFEEIEAITIIDVLRRAGVTVEVAGTEPGPITGSHGITVTPDRPLAGIDAGAYDLVALPGGMPRTLHLRQHAEVRRIVRQLASRGCYTTAICAPPTVLAAAQVPAGCAGKKPIIPPAKLWGEAEEAFNIDAYELAVDRYKKLLDQHPFDQHAEEAELKIALSYYKAQRWAEAIAAFGDFERMHPTSAELPAVEYHLGMAYLAQASTSDRDQQSHANALTYFRNLI